MSNTVRRIAAAFAILLALSLPLAAQALPGRSMSLSSLLAALWQRLAAPVAALWAEDTTSTPTSDPATTTDLTTDPNPDGRGVIDPLG
jgi:hypothetical protein